MGWAKIFKAFGVSRPNRLLFIVLYITPIIIIIELFFLASEGGASRLTEIETFFFLFSFVRLDVVFLNLCTLFGVYG